MHPRSAAAPADPAGSLFPIMKTSQLLTLRYITTRAFLSIHCALRIPTLAFQAPKETSASKMAPVPQHAAAALLLGLLMHLSPGCLPYVAAQADTPNPGPTPLQCPPGEYSDAFGGTQCCPPQLTCRLTTTAPDRFGNSGNITATCCPRNTVCLYDYTPFAACVTPPPNQCTTCPNLTDPFSGNYCRLAGNGQFCCFTNICGAGDPSTSACCDQGNQTQCTYPISGIASPTATSRCCEPGKLICGNQCCDVAKCVAASPVGPFTCNEPGGSFAEEKQGGSAPCVFNPTPVSVLHFGRNKL
jgi:hypothetical protein